jgi:hypothetical protein
MAAERATDATEVWFTVGTAADAAGVPRRSAFRWAAAGRIPVRMIGPRRCTEVGALRLFAASRGGTRAMAPMQATPHGESATPPSVPPDEDTTEAIAALSEGLVCAQEQALALLNRVDRIERALGLRR